MLKRILVLPLVLAVAALLITIAVSNRHPVRIVLDPLSEQPLLAFELPFFVYLLGALILGVVLGGMRTWLGQSHWRRSARARAQDAMRWEAEASRLQREREEAVVASRASNATPAGAGTAGSGRSLALARR